MRTYEAMFLFDPSFASEANNAEQEVARLMERAGARIIMNKKWEERKLAYEIKGRKRGSYWLTFFEADSNSIGGIERDAGISEPILRLLIQRADHMTEEDMNKAYTARTQPAPHKHAGPETRPGDDAKPAAKETQAAKVDEADKPPVVEAPPAKGTGDDPDKSVPPPTPANEQADADNQAPTPAPAD
ncbi:MAG: 30S ribosomal protein S6 [Phycisphaerae bacterium]